MTEEQLVATLADLYSRADAGKQVVAIHLFAIEFATELQGHSLNRIAEGATGKKSYGTELRKGMNLAPFVSLGSKS